MKAPARARGLAVLLTTAALWACTPLSHSLVLLNGSDAGDPAAVALIDTDPGHPLLLRGLDEKPLAVRVPSALRTWTYVVAPGRHRLWVSSVPYGHPFLPQRIRCYVIEATLDAGVRYVLKDDPANEWVLLTRHGGGEAVAAGRLVDAPLVTESGCRWPAPSRGD